MTFYFADSRFFFSLLALVFLPVILVFEVLMFIDVIKNKAISDQARILWVVGMVIFHPVVALIYYFTDRKKSL